MSVRASTGQAEGRWLFPGVMVLAALLRLHELGARSLWTDEGSTWTAASLPLPQLIERCLVRDASPPLYYLVTSLFLHLGGGTEAALRFSSLLASLGLVWLTYRLARLALARPAASLAALFCALAPYQLMYAQEARTYTLVALFSVWGTYLYMRGLLGPGIRAWFGYAVVTALGLWTQSIALLALPAQGLIAIGTHAGRRRLLMWVLALAAAAVLYSPWAWLSREMADHLAHSHWYIEEPTVLGLVKVLRGLLLSPMPLVTAPAGSVMPGLDRVLPRALAWALLVLPPMVLLGASLRHLLGRSTRGSLTRLLWLAWVTPLAAVLAVSLLGRPLFLPRYFVFATPYVAVLFVLGAMALPARLRAVPVALLVLVQCLGILRYHHDATKEPWRDMAAHMDEVSPSGRTAALVLFDADPLRFYERRHAPGIRSFEVSHPAEPFAANFSEPELAYIDSAAHANVQGYDEVWVFVRSPKSPIRHRVVAIARAAAAEGRVLAEQRDWESFGGPVMSWRYTKPAGPDSLGPR